MCPSLPYSLTPFLLFIWIFLCLREGAKNQGQEIKPPVLECQPPETWALLPFPNWQLPGSGGVSSIRLRAP